MNPMQSQQGSTQSAIGNQLKRSNPLSVERHLEVLVQQQQVFLAYRQHLVDHRMVASPR